jgi:hypothetical protein
MLGMELHVFAKYFQKSAYVICSTGAQTSSSNKDLSEEVARTGTDA